MVFGTRLAVHTETPPVVACVIRSGVACSAALFAVPLSHLCVSLSVWHSVLNFAILRFCAYYHCAAEARLLSFVDFLIL